MKTQLSGGESDDLFVAVEVESWTIRGAWPVVTVRIQCFDFGSRWEVTGRSVAGR
jgi:hypothetical protein